MRKTSFIVFVWIFMGMGTLSLSEPWASRADQAAPHTAQPSDTDKGRGADCADESEAFSEKVYGLLKESPDDINGTIRNLFEAYSMTKEWLSDRPDCIEANNAALGVFLAVGDCSEAKRCLAKVESVRDKFDAVDLALFRANLHVICGEWAMAIRSADEVLRLVEKGADALTAAETGAEALSIKVFSLLMAGDAESAERLVFEINSGRFKGCTIESHLENVGQIESVYFFKSFIYKKNEISPLIAKLHAVVRDNPVSLQAHIYLFSLHRLMSDFPAMQAEFREIARLNRKKEAKLKLGTDYEDPGSPSELDEVHLALSRIEVLRQMGDTANALTTALRLETRLEEFRAKDSAKWDALPFDRSDPYPNSPRLRPKLLMLIGGFYSALGRFDLYIKYCDKAATAAENNDPVTEGITLLALGILQIQFGDPEKGMACIDRLIDRSKRMLATNRYKREEIDEAEAWGLLSAGQGLAMIGDLAKGEQLLRQFMEMEDDDPLTRPNNRFCVPVVLAGAAQNAGNVGVANAFLREAETALAEFSKKYTSSMEQRGFSPDLSKLVLEDKRINLQVLKAGILLDADEPVAAEKMARETLAVAEKAVRELEALGSETVRQAGNLVWDLDKTRRGIPHLIGLALKAQGRFEEAIPFFEDSLKWMQSSAPPVMTSRMMITEQVEASNELLVARMELLGLYKKTGKNDRATALEKLLGATLADFRPTFPNCLSLTAGLSDSDILLLNPSDSERLCALALEGVRKAGLPTLTALAERNLGMAMWKRGKRADARAHYEAAVALLEKWRTGLSALPEAIRRGLSQGLAPIYEEYLEILVETGEMEKALDVYERFRSRVLAEMLQRSQVVLATGGGIVESEKQASAQMEKIDRELSLRTMAVQDDPFGENARRVGVLLKEKDVAAADIQRAMDAVKERLPGRYGIYNAFSVRDIQSALRPDEIALVYFTAETRLVVWAVSVDGIKPFVFPVSEKDLKRKVEDFRNEMWRFYDTDGVVSIREMERMTASIEKAGFELYCTLFKPVEEEIRGRKVVVVPSGCLFRLPFEAMVRDVPTHEYLLRKYTISYVQSLTVLATVRRGKASAAKDPLAAFADPVFQGLAFQTTPEYRGIGVSPAKPLVETYGKTGKVSFPPLPDSRKEAGEVAAALKADPAKSLYLGVDASESNVKKLSSNGYFAQKKYILFATHGIVGGEVTYFRQPSLVLSPGTVDGEDGFLEMREIFNLSLDAEMVTLSACQTGVGESDRAEGVVAFPRAFLYAGARAVTVSLWKVDSLAATELVSEFHRQIGQGGKSRSAALREAKLKLLDGTKPRYRNPFFWSPFILIGERE